jgi:predicted TIM-barrel fold metal-dependent hydrolase
MHKENAYVDLSGWSPRHFQPLLVTYMIKLISSKFLFGTDYPMLKPERWLNDFETLRVSPEVWDMVLRDNAKRGLKL